MPKKITLNDNKCTGQFNTDNFAINVGEPFLQLQCSTPKELSLPGQKTNKFFLFIEVA